MFENPVLARDTLSVFCLFVDVAGQVLPTLMLSVLSHRFIATHVSVLSGESKRIKFELDREMLYIYIYIFVSSAHKYDGVVVQLR